MTISSAQTPTALGFLTVLEDEQHGLLGGYLLLNKAGRPLEFHCTSPVKPNRAQEILFGPTLDAYLYGEQIGQTLVAKGTIAPALICTNHPAALAVREFVACPVALVEEPAGKHYRVDAAHSLPAKHFLCERGGDRVSLSSADRDDRTQAEACLANLADGFTLSEPFTRILAAMDEARRGAK